MQKALGIIETFGLLAGIVVADTMVKAANVELIGYELSRGQGMTVIKIQGDVGAVNAAIASGEALARELGLFRGKDVIPRPADGLELMVFNKDTAGSTPANRDADDKTVPAAEQSTNELFAAQHKDDNTVNAESLSIEEAEVSRITTCNLCHDPECPRKPRQPHKACIHFSVTNEDDGES